MRVVVAGGGAVGSAVALFLKRLGGAAVEVVVVEPDPTLALASSARSAGSVRQQFSAPLNIAMSRYGHAVISGQDPLLAIDGVQPDLGWVPGAYLFLTDAAGAAAMRARHALQREAGAPVALLDAAAVAARMPWLATDDLALATLGEAGEGWLDGQLLARALAASARALGARWQPGRVAGIQRAGGRLQAVQLDDGQVLAADALVLACGAWSHAVGRALGLPVPVHARRRTVFHLQCPTPLPATPLVVDGSGCWFRSEGRGFLAGWSPGPGDADPDDLPLDQPALEQFEDRGWPALARRVPAFEALRVAGAWAGWYEVHPLDHNALIGPHPDDPRVWLCCGFSGHGLQHAPAAARGLAERMLTGRYTTLDLSPLDPQRIRTGQPFGELAVI